MVDCFCLKYADMSAEEIKNDFCAAIDEKLHSQYGSTPDKKIARRVQEEWLAMEQSGMTLIAAALYEITCQLKKSGYDYWFAGNAGASFIFYLLGITAGNPLPPHLHCAYCHRVIWREDFADGFDIPQGTFCENDGELLIADGHDEPWQSLWGYGEYQPNFEVRLPFALQDDLIQMLRNHWLQLYEKEAVLDVSRLDKFRSVHFSKMGFVFILDEEPKCGKNNKFDRNTVLKNWEDYVDFGEDDAEKNLPMPQTFADLLSVFGLLHSTGAWNRTNEFMVKQLHYRPSEIIAFREDVFKYLLRHGFLEKDAWHGMEEVRKGHQLPVITDEMKTAEDRWILTCCEEIIYMFPKAHAVEYILFKAKNTDCFRELLIKVSENISENKASTYTPFEKYNIFGALEVSSKEVIMCRFLADLLNPEGRHGCGILFLKTFLQNVLGEDRVDDTLLNHTDVIKEFGIDEERRIDIVIRNSCYCIPIEVKIYAEEQEGQCYDYYQYAANYPYIVYLTRFGSAPSEYSSKNRNGKEILSVENDVKRISWDEDICGWLTALLPQLDEPLRTTVMQYIDAIRSIADRRDKIIMDKNLEILWESEAFFNAGLEIEKSMKAAKLNLIRLVFEDLKREMEPITREYGLEEEKEACYCTYEDKRHEKFYDCYSTYPGLNYVVNKAKFSGNGIQMWFRIEVEHNLFAGFCLYDREAETKDGKKGDKITELTPSLVEEAAAYLDRNIIKIQNKHNWWLTYCYPNGKTQEAVYADVPNFMEMNECAVSLIDERKRAKFIRSAVKVFEGRLLTHLL